MSSSADPERPKPPPDTICFCFQVTERTLRRLIEAHDITSIDELAQHTFAGQGCRTCRLDLELLIERVRGSSGA